MVGRTSYKRKQLERFLPWVGFSGNLRSLREGFTGRMLSGEGSDITDIRQRRKVRLVSSRDWLQLAPAGKL